MEKLNIKTTVVHSKSKAAWNVIGTRLGGKYKIARIPYAVHDWSEILTAKNRHEALVHAQFISQCFNNADKIIGKVF